MARAQWVALQELNALSDSELRELLAESYRLVFERLPKKRQLELQGSASKSKSNAAAKSGKKKSAKAGRAR
jgi:hypothetical protein